MRTNVFDKMIMKEGVIIMKKTLIDLGGVLLFYLILIFGVIILNMRFTELNKNVNAGLIVSTY